MALGSHRGLAYKQKMKTVVRLKVTKISQFTKKQFRIYKLGKNLCAGKLKLMFGTSPRETACTDTGKCNEGRSHALQVSRHFIGTDASDAQQSSLAERCLLPRPARTLRLGAPCTSQQGTGRTSWKVERGPKPLQEDGSISGLHKHELPLRCRDYLIHTPILF